MISAGDIYWAVLDPVLGTEQAGRRPALIVSDGRYDEMSTRAVICPITRVAREWPFEVPLPPVTMTRGVVLVDQIRTVHRGSRLRDFIETAPASLLDEVRGRLAALVGLSAHRSDP